MAKLRASMLLGLLCVLLWLACDFGYSNILFLREPSPRTYSPLYSHDLVPNFDGYAAWGRTRYRFLTNSLGFRDGAVREVPLVGATRRVLLIGDSNTEGLGVAFEDSFAGLLYRYGRDRGDRIEFLNAAVVSYSPTLYDRKLRALFERGLRFDEVIVFSDISDVNDEATTYFCFDRDPAYRSYCPQGAVGASASVPSRSWHFDDNFIVTARTNRIVRYAIDSLLSSDTKSQLHGNRRAAWTIRDFQVGQYYAPLGIEGGIARSLKNMQALADFLGAHLIPLSIVVSPWPMQIAKDDRDSRQVAIWREFCVRNCKTFVDTFPAFFAQKDAHEDWYQRLFIRGDMHFSPAGHELLFQQVAKRLFESR